MKHKHESTERRITKALIENIAQATHEVNRTYCQALGDDSQVPWGEAPAWQRESAISGIKAVVDGAAATPKEQHESWMDVKHRDGWTYGDDKDATAKTHPCMVPYDELPASQRAKDSLFRAVVLGMLGKLGD